MYGYVIRRVARAAVGDREAYEREIVKEIGLPVYAHGAVRGYLPLAGVHGRETEDPFVHEPQRLCVQLECRARGDKGVRVSRVHEDYILIDAAWADKAGLKCTKSGKARVVPNREDEEPGHGDDLREDRQRVRVLRQQHHALRGQDYNLCHGQRHGEGGDRRQGGRNLTFHSFRNFFNTQMVSSGIPSEVVRKTVGHESGEMTGRYFHAGEAALGL